MADLAAAEYTRGRIREMVLDLLARYDHLVTPAMAIPPFPVEQNYPETVAGKPMKTYVDWIAPTFVLSLTGLPVGVAPCGLDSEGLPVGLQIVGRPFGEETVLALAGAVQRVNPIGPPPLDRLAAGKAAL
jgi:amidase